MIQTAIDFVHKITYSCNREHHVVNTVLSGRYLWHRLCHSKIDTQHTQSTLSLYLSIFRALLASRAAVLQHASAFLPLFLYKTCNNVGLIDCVYVIDFNDIVIHPGTMRQASLALAEWKAVELSMLLLVLWIPAR